MVLIATQYLREQGETNEAEIQKAEDNGGCALPGQTTQCNATYPAGASGNQMEQLLAYFHQKGHHLVLYPNYLHHEKTTQQKVKVAKAV